jgi:hypothetical protein
MVTRIQRTCERRANKAGRDKGILNSFNNYIITFAGQN